MRRTDSAISFPRSEMRVRHRDGSANRDFESGGIGPEISPCDSPGRAGRQNFRADDRRGRLR